MFGKLLSGFNDIIGKVKTAVTGIGKRIVNFTRKIPTIGNQVRAMDTEDIVYAKMCNEVYKKPSERQNLDGYMHTNDSDLHSIYSDGRERVLAIRGTDDLNDVVTDISIVTGREADTQRFQDELKFARDNNITKCTGHSLGGTISAYISSQLSIPCVIFNAGAGANSVLSMFKPSNQSLIKSYKIQGDPISLLWSQGNIKILAGKPDMNPHTINQFI